MVHATKSPLHTSARIRALEYILALETVRQSIRVQPGIPRIYHSHESRHTEIPWPTATAGLETSGKWTWAV